MCKVYNSAPLPFQGQKRRFVSDFRDILSRFDDVDTVVDLFGGSGLLSHVTKRQCPNAKVIFNDYDYYCHRLANVEITNAILRELRPLLETVPDNKKVPNVLRQQILDIILRYAGSGYVDYITLSSSLLFSGKWAKSYEELAKHTMYNCIKQNDYVVEGYLDGLEVVHTDYLGLFNKYKDKDRTLFLIDPPYLSTDSVSYSGYWKLADYLDVLKLLIGTRYIYFTSNKSQIIELCRWIKENASIGNPFEGVEVRTQHNNLNYGSAFTDIMLVQE